MKQPKSGPRWDDRVAIAFMLALWLGMGFIGLYEEVRYVWAWLVLG